ncbi:MAG: glycosyltransferase family 2 protein [Elusimicrobiota bacterium]|nr:glycosyltransferase family 2 protein [Elusimicrobiota bacterium]
MKKISIITGVYNEELTIREVYETIRKTFEVLSTNYDYEHIFMDNCSTDDTLSILKEIASKDKKVKLITYSKNFGPVKNEFIGYKYSTGDAVVDFEANLKDPAEMIPIFIKNWEDGYDVVYGVRNKTKDNFLMLFMRKTFYKICSLLSEEPLPLNAGGFRLVDRKVVNELIKLDDYKPYIRGIITTIGFKQIGINYERKARPRGKSKSNFGYLVDFAINAFISYSVVPIRFCTYIGVILSAFSFLIALLYVVIKIFFWDIQAPGIATVIVLILFFSGIQLFFLGVIGEYIGAIHSQVRKKPFVVIKEKINF